MSAEIWTPNAVPKPDPNEKILVLEHHQSHRLFFLIDGIFARTIAKQGFIVHEVESAHEFDSWAKKILSQERDRAEQEDYLHACQVDERRKKLRDELHAKLLATNSPQERKVLEATLNALEMIRRQKERVRNSYFVKQAYEHSRTDAAEQIVTDIITNKSNG